MAWSISHQPDARAPDPISCSAFGSPFNVRSLHGSPAGPELSLNVAFHGELSHETDFCVFLDHRSVGRIRIASGTPLDPDWRWEINLPLPVPPWAHGSTKSLPEAKEAFAKAWKRFYGTLTPDDIEHWQQTPDTVIKR